MSIPTSASHLMPSAVSSLGSEHDRPSFSSERLRSDTELLDEYNGLMLRAIGTADYDDRKSASFTRITTQ